MQLIDRIRKALTRKRAPFIELSIGDITREHVDVVVNAAKQSLLGGGGVDGAIHAAGGPAILAMCQAIRDTTHPDGLPIGEAVATTAGRMPARWVVHTVGPVYRPADDRQSLLRACYTSSLAVAERLGAETVAFPLISSGVYGWPVKDAIHQALQAISSGRYRNVKRVKLVLFDEKTYSVALSRYEAGGYWL